MRRNVISKIVFTFCLVIGYFNSNGQQTQPGDTPVLHYPGTTIGLTILDAPAPNSYTFDATAYTSQHINYLNDTLGLNADLSNFKHLWSFGDGHTSTLVNPTHTYAGSHNGPTTYEVSYIGTPIHLPMGPPPSAYIAYAPLTVENPETPIHLPTLTIDEDIKIELNRDPVANEEITVVVTYRNNHNLQSAAFVNFDFEYDEHYFELIHVYAYEGDTYVNSTSSVSDPSKYSIKHNYISGTVLDHLEEGKILFQMRAKEEVLGELIHGPTHIDFTQTPHLYFGASTNAGNFGPSGSFDALMTQAVGSWDPNVKLVSHPFLLNDSLVDPITLRYRINFENEGVSSTNFVSVIDSIHPLLDISSIDTSTMTFKYTPNNVSATPSASIREFKVLFPGLSLAGANDPNILDIDDSKFWFEFDIDIDVAAWNSYIANYQTGVPVTEAFNFGTEATIIFDNNSPMSTNIELTSVINNYRPVGIVNSIVPNPARSATRISYTVSKPITGGNSYLYLIDLKTGSQINQTNTIGSRVGTYSTTIDVSTLNNGVYVLGIYSPEGIFTTMKLIKI